jgi:hypothetical protein
VTETVEQDLPNEIAYLEAYDNFILGVERIVDMPAPTADLLHRFLRQNHGTLSQRAREKEFASLQAQEITDIERLFAETAGSPVVRVGAGPEVSVRAGDDIVIPIHVDMPVAAGSDLAAIQIVVSWDPAKLSLKVEEPGNWADKVTGAPAVVLVNPTIPGAIRIAGFLLHGATESFTLRTITLHAVDSGIADVDVGVSAAGNSAGASLPCGSQSLRVVILP